MGESENNTADDSENEEDTLQNEMEKEENEDDDDQVAELSINLMAEEIERKVELVDALEKSLAQQDQMRQNYETQIESLRLQIAEKENLKNKQLATLKSKLKAGANTGSKERLNEVKK